MDKESRIRHYVRELRTFYTNLTIYALVCFFCVLVWACMGGGVFWPLWVFLGCGLAAVLEGTRLGQLPQLEEFLPFLRPEWESRYVERLMNHENFEKMVKKTPPKKPQQ